MPLETTLAPPPVATPAPAEAAPTVARESTSFDAAFPDDGLDAPTPAPEPAKPAPELPKDEPKPEAGALEKPAVEPKPEPEAPATPEGADFEAPKVSKPSELRNWANKMGRRAQKAEQEAKKLSAELEQARNTAPRADTAKVDALTKELAAARQQAEQYLADLKSSSYTKDPAFQEKYTAPRLNAIKRVYREIKELTAYDPNPEDPENPKARDATPGDFDKVYFASNTTAAMQIAKQIFGDAWHIAFDGRKEIRRLTESEQEATQEWNKTAAERESQRTAQATQFEQARQSMWSQANDAYTKKRPELFSPRDGDKEGNELLQKGQQFAQSVFGGNDGLDLPKVVMRDARAYNWLAAFPRLSRDLAKEKAANAELKKQVESLRASGPGKPGAGAATPAGKERGKFSEDFDSVFGAGP